MFVKTKNNWYLNLKTITSFNVRKDGYGKFSIFAYPQSGDNWWIIAQFVDEADATAYLDELVAKINAEEKSCGRLTETDCLLSTGSAKQQTP